MVRSEGASRLGGPARSSGRWRPSSSCDSQDDGSALAGADADRLLDVEDEDLPVPRLAGVGELQDHVNGPLQVDVVHRDLELQLRPQEDRRAGAPVALREPLLPAGALRLRDRHGREAHRGEAVVDALQRLVADVGLDLLHARRPLVSPGGREPPRALDPMACPGARRVGGPRSAAAILGPDGGPVRAHVDDRGRAPRSAGRDRRPGRRRPPRRRGRGPQFAGLSRLEQHKLVYAAVQSRFDDGSIHALALRTRAPEAT